MQLIRDPEAGTEAINKLKIVVLGVGIVLIAVPLLPNAVRGRLYSLTGESHDGGAEGSSDSRMALLTESVKVALVGEVGEQ